MPKRLSPILLLTLLPLLSPALPALAETPSPAASAEAATPPWQPAAVPTTDTLHNGFFLDESRGWLITHQSGEVLRTDDGGRSWTRTADLPDGYLETVRFTDAEHGWLCGDEGRLFRSEDGGVTWERVSPPWNGPALGSVHFFDRDRGFAAGFDPLTAEGRLWTTSDGGATWQARPEGTATLWTDALAVDGEEAWVGGRGRLLHTAHGGAAWRALELPAKLAPRGVAFRGRFGVVAGSEGRVAVSWDRGESWWEAPATASPLLRTVYVSDGSLGDDGLVLAAGDPAPDGSTLFLGEDGGARWLPAAGPSTAVHRLLPGFGRLWALGADGRLWHAEPSALRGEGAEPLTIGTDLQVFPMGGGIWRHLSVKDQGGDWGRIPANGLLVVSGKEAVLIDTPWTEEQTRQLFRWAEEELGAKVTGVVPTHSHEDCLGGLAAAHEMGADSFGLEKTAEIARETGATPPHHVFSEAMDLRVGTRVIELRYLGPGHTVDNIVAWVPDAEGSETGVLFGGCLVKSAATRGMGYVGEADLAAWPATLERVAEEFPGARIVPGHGGPGGADTLERTRLLLEAYVAAQEAAAQEAAKSETAPEAAAGEPPL